MLKVKFKRVDNVVLMKVLEQSDIEIGAGDFFVGTRGMSISSTKSPELRPNTIYVRGIMCGHDSKTVAFELHNVAEARAYLCKCVTTIKEYNDYIKMATKPIIIDENSDKEEEIIIGG